MSAKGQPAVIPGTLAELARLALHGSRRDVEMYVHRLAHRHRGTKLGDMLAEVDVLPGVSLRDLPPDATKPSTP